MSSRVTLRPHLVITNGDMSGSLTSAVTILQGLTSCSYTITWSGSGVGGLLAVEASNDFSLNPDGSVNNTGNWAPMLINVNGTPDVSLQILVDTGTAFIDITKTATYAIRLTYTRNSGTGSMNATIVGKVS